MAEDGEFQEPSTEPVHLEAGHMFRAYPAKERRVEIPSELEPFRQRLNEAFAQADRWAKYLADHGLSSDDVGELVVDACVAQPHLIGASTVLGRAFGNLVVGRRLSVPAEGGKRWAPSATQYFGLPEESDEAAESIRDSTWDDEVDEGSAIARQALAELRSKTEPLPQGI